MADRSWTDAVTGASLLAGFDIVEYLQWLSSRHTRVNRSLTQFLHEGTHHWCFDSPVGAAVSQLLLRARRRALLAADEDPAALFADVTRATVAEALLHPIAEGLALFAEFDIRPGASSAQSMTMTAVQACFSFPLKTDGRNPAEIALNAMLQETRRQPEYLERKAGIYAMPFDCADGYLAGYLAVKQLWVALAAASPSLRDTDLFLAFLRTYIYDDARLVLLLLEGDADPAGLAEALANHLLERFGLLVDATPQQLQSRVAGWEQACAVGEDIHPHIDVAEADRQQAEHQIFLLLDDVQEQGDAMQFAAHAFMTAKNRKYMTLGSLAATARRSEAGYDIVGDPGTDDLRFTLTSLPSGLAQGQGELVAVLAYRAPMLAVYFRVGKECVRVHAFGDTDLVDATELQHYVLNRQLNEELHADLEQALDSVMAEPDWQAAVDEVRDVAAQAADALYSELATLQADRADQEQVLSRLRAGGLLELLDGDVDLVRAIALIGLANTMGSDPVSLAMFAAFAKLDPAVIDRAIQTAQRRHGLPLLLPTSSGGAIALT